MCCSIHTNSFPISNSRSCACAMHKFFGRLMILGTSVLPHHHGIIHPEEMAVQLYLLSVSLKPILRSMELYKCMADAKKDGSTSTTTTNCVEECALELEELEASLDIKNVV